MMNLALSESKLEGGIVEKEMIEEMYRDYKLRTGEEPSKEVYDRIKADNVLIGKARSINSNLTFFKEKFKAPLKNSIITGVYGSQRILNGKPRRPHYGIDFHAPEGTPVKAMMDGETYKSN